MQGDSTRLYYEFFAGGGMARLGLASPWACAFANDIDQAKGRAYGAMFGPDEMRIEDVWNLEAHDLPGQAAMAWASFPCQDLSLAGARRGLSAPRSGAFWGFWRLIERLDRERRAPPLLALENVAGLLTSHGGADFAALCATLAARGYRCGALTIDAALFTPQSRPRVFVIATRGPIDDALIQDSAGGPFHSPNLIDAAARLTGPARDNWLWWRLPAPPARNTSLADLLDPDDCVEWADADATARLLTLMAPRQRARLDEEAARGERRAGAAFRRMRVENGEKTQRLEARFDGLAGCLRTPAGGSSRQSILVTERGRIRSRLLTPRECARLMGVPDEYPMPPSANAALHLFGDGVCVPVVRWLSAHLLESLASSARARVNAA